MTWHYNEVVRSGNSHARVKNYYPETGLIVLHNISGEIKAGSTIVGDDSGSVMTLSNFTISDEFDLDYEPTYWPAILEAIIYAENGQFIALDEHFSGKPSQDYQTTYLLVAA